MCDFEEAVLSQNPWEEWIIIDVCMFRARGREMQQSISTTLNIVLFCLLNQINCRNGVFMELDSNNITL